MNQAKPPPSYLLWLWFLYPLLVPFYFLGKTPVPGTEKVQGGVPQLADYCMVGIMALVLAFVPFRADRSVRGLLKALLCFVGYTVLVNGCWAVVLENPSLLKSSLYYAYDALLLLTCLILYQNYRERFLFVTVWAVWTSVVLQALLSPLAPHQAYARQPLFFNNENQLGYFCVLTATIFVLGARQFSIRTHYQVIFYLALSYLALESQSRSALLALGALAVVALLGRPMRLLIAVGAIAAILLIISLTPPLLSKYEERLVVPGEYDTLATRGYDRIVNYPEYLVFGAGEGAYLRFRSELYGSEIHSSLGTVLFCYGVPGSVLFIVVLALLCKRNWRIALFLAPALIHGLGHQAVRFAFSWAMLAFLCCLALGAEQSTTAEDPAPAEWDVEPGEPQPAT